MRNYPINDVRIQFPSLEREYNGKKVVYLDGPGGSQVVKGTIDAIVHYMSHGGANLHGNFPTSKETAAYIKQSRDSIADLVAASPDEISFGQNATSLAFSIARSVSKNWIEGDEIILSEIDHPANIDSWLTVAYDKNLTVKWLKVNPGTLTLDISALDKLINEKTKLIAVTLASNAIGTITDIDAINKFIGNKNILLSIDAVHAIPHFPIDKSKLKADIILCSAYKFFGPHVGIAVINKQLFEKIDPYKVAPAPNYIPDKLETGTQNFSGIASIKPAIEFIENLGKGKSRRERILSGYKVIEEHENYLVEYVRSELKKLPSVKIYESSEGTPKTPTIAFRVDGVNPAIFCKKMSEDYSVFVADGHFYATRLAEVCGVLENGGWIRIGIAPYNTIEEMKRFVNATKDIINEL